MSENYAVIGNPVSHSRVPHIHSVFAGQTGLNLVCRAVEGNSGAFPEAADAFRATGGCGMSVLAPFTLDALRYASDLSEQARLAGTANALMFKGGRVLASNFDGVGLVRDIVHNLGFPMSGRRVLLLGAGRAARAAIPPILEQKPARLLVVNRTESKAQLLAEQFSALGRLSASSYPDLGASPSAFDIVINATSASLHGELPPVHTEVFSPDCLAYELVCGKGLTPFLRLAQGSGARRLADGVGMLVEQAAETFLWWRGVRPETHVLINTLAVPLA